MPKNPDKIFAVGDVHGCARELKLLLEKLPLTGDATLLFVGDYIDRGAQSREVVDTILELRRDHPVVTLLGNHESMFLEFLDDPKSRTGAMFIYNGGSATLASYADDYGKYAIPEEHRTFFRELQLYHETEHLFCVHAGLPEIPLAELDPHQHRQELLWSRQMARSHFRWEKLIVHGHSPVSELRIQPTRLNVDTGCVFDGALSAVELPAMRVYSVPLQGKEAPTYLRDLRSKRRAVRFEGSIPVAIEARGAPIHFLTINFSEVGMLLRCVSNSATVRLRVNEQVNGTIGARGSPRVKFSGLIVRQEEREIGSCFAVKILSCTEWVR